MIEYINIKQQHCAVIVRAKYSSPGIQFFTESSDTMQLGYMNRPAGYKITPHIHKALERTIQYTQETLFIRSGRLLVNFYDDNHICFKKVIVETGDVILFKNGGHGFEFLEDSDVIEVKQGPYAGELDKEKISNL
jgi:hypothetical protein